MHKSWFGSSRWRVWMGRLVDCHLEVLWIFQLCIPIYHTLVYSIINRLSKWKSWEGWILELRFLTSSNDRVTFFEFFILLIISRINEFLIIYISIFAVVDSAPNFRLSSRTLLLILLKILRFEKLTLFRWSRIVPLELSCWNFLLFINGGSCCCGYALLYIWVT